jgi:glycosyltransferase involved in cell wall biosynthesis
LNKNSLYITFDGLSDPLGQSQILPYIISLAQQGYHITVLSCEKPTSLKAEKENILQKIKDLPVQWKYIEYSTDGGSFSRYSYIKQLAVMAEQECNTKTISLTHCRSYLSALIGLRLKRKRKIPFLFDMRGFWADERVDGGIWKKNNLLHRYFYNYFKRKEKQFIAESDQIVSLTNAALKVMDENFPSLHLTQKTKIIPCCTNLDSFDRSKVKAADLPAGVSQNDFLLIYTGSIGTWYFTKEMIDCVLAWRKFIPTLKLLVLTKDQEELKKVLGNYSLEQRKCIVSTSASYHAVPSYLALAKAAIYFIKPVYSKIASCPTKMAECWAMDLPIITNKGIGDNDIYFNEHKGGILLSQFTTEEYEKAARSFLNLQKQKTDYRAIATGYFDNKRAAQTYIDIYRNLSA